MGKEDKKKVNTEGIEEGTWRFKYKKKKRNRICTLHNCSSLKEEQLQKSSAQRRAAKCKAPFKRKKERGGRGASSWQIEQRQRERLQNILSNDTISFQTNSV